MANEKDTEEKGVVLTPRMYNLWKFQETGEDLYYSKVRESMTAYTYSIIQPYGNYRGVDIEELKQIADVALLDCMKAFDPDRCNYSEDVFRTYVSRAAQRAVWNYLKEWTNYASRGDTHLEVLHVDFHTLESRSPDSNDELTNADGINSVQTFNIIGDSLEDAGIEFLDLTREDIDKPDEEEEVEYDSKEEEDVNTLLNCLDERERAIIVLNYGLGGTEKKRLDEIGEQLGMSMERASKLRQKALEKMRIAALQQNIVYL